MAQDGSPETDVADSSRREDEAESVAGSDSPATQEVSAPEGESASEDETASGTVEVTVGEGERGDQRADAGSTESKPTRNEAAAVRRARAVSDLLDDAFRIPGTNVRLGLDPVLGIAPGGGDAVAAALSLYPVLEAYRLDAPPTTIAKMLTLIAIDFGLGSIPILGTAFDAFWKANTWNVDSLERHVEGS